MAASLPRITLVTPNYNYGHFLEETLVSVLRQEYPNLEYLVLDDGSTDGSVDIIRRYADRLAYWQCGENKGQYKTITEGLNRGTGELMGWINSDDMHMPWTLRAVGQIFASFPDVEWISTLHPGLWDYEGICKGFIHYDGFSREYFLDGRHLTRGFVQQESTFWRRSLWERAGGLVSHEYGSAGDFDLWARFYEHADLVGIDLPLAGFRVQYRQQTANVQRYTELCSRSLADARLRAGWTGPAVGRRVVEAFGLRRVPKVRGWATRQLGYTGRRICRTDAAGPTCGWTMESYRFL